jgi:hypothetical protein
MILSNRHCPLFQRELPWWERVMYCTGVWSYLVGAVTTPVFIAVPLVTIWAGIFPIVVSWWAAGAAPSPSRAGPSPPPTCRTPVWLECRQLSCARAGRSDCARHKSSTKGSGEGTGRGACRPAARGAAWPRHTCARSWRGPAKGASGPPRSSPRPTPQPRARAVGLTTYFCAQYAVLNYVRRFKHITPLWFANVANNILWWTFVKACWRAAGSMMADRGITFKTTMKARAACPPLLSDAFCVRAHVRAGSPVTAYARARPPTAVCCCSCAPAGTRRCLAGSRAEARLPGLQGAGRLMNANIGDLWMPTICLLGLMASLGAAPTPRTVAPGAPPRAFCQAARHALCVWRAAACCAPASAPLSVCLPGWRRLGSLPMRCAAEAVYLPVSWHTAV